MTNNQATGQKSCNQITIRRGCHTVNFHDGTKTHHDGSPFFDMKIFHNARDAQKCIRLLKASGYEESR